MWSSGNLQRWGFTLHTLRQRARTASCAGRDWPLVRRNGSGATIARKQRGRFVQRRNRVPKEGFVTSITRQSEDFPGWYNDVVLKACLLYTSDAADDLLCVDLGG